MSIKHAFHSPVADGGEASKVQPSNWNQAHIFEILTTDPVAPTAGMFWMIGTGTTPNRLIELKLCDTDSVVVTLLSLVR